MIKCKYCNTEIAFLKNKKGYKVPVQWSSLNRQEKDDIINGMTRLLDLEVHVVHSCMLKNYKGQKDE